MNYKTLLIPFFAGFIYALGFPLTWAPSFFIMPVLGMALFMSQFHIFNSAKEYSFLKESVSFFSFCFAIYLFGYYWIPYTMAEFGGIHFPLNYLVGSLFTLIVFPQYILFGIAYFALRKFKRPHLSLPLKNLILAFTLSFLEYFTPQQFPAHIGHSWIQLAPYLGLAPIFGYSIYSFTSYYFSLSLLSKFSEKKWDYRGTVFFIIVLISSAVLRLEYQPENGPVPKSTHIRMTQASVGNFLKMDSEKGGVSSTREVRRRYFKLSTKPPKKDLDLIIWPETSYPALFSSKDLKEDPSSIDDIFKKVTSMTNAEIFFGSYDINLKSNNDNFESEFNTGFLIDDKANIKDIYHKMKLIPFGEGLPFGRFNKKLSKYFSNISFFAKGDRFTLFKLRNEASFVNLICYEILFPKFVRDNFNGLKERPHFIVNLTNDSWYGKTSEPYHHLSLSKWRALEFNLPIVRMTNTGISSVLYPDGSESKRTGLFTQEYLDVDLKTSQNPATLYQRFGYLIMLILFGIMLLLIALWEALSKKSS